MAIKDNKGIKIKQLNLITQETDKLPTAAPTVSIRRFKASLLQTFSSFLTQNDTSAEMKSS